MQVVPPRKRKVGNAQAAEATEENDDNASTAKRFSKRLKPESRFEFDTTKISAAAKISLEADVFELLKTREVVLICYHFILSIYYNI